MTSEKLAELEALYAKARIPPNCFVYAEPEVDYGPDIHAIDPTVHQSYHAPIGLNQTDVLEAVAAILTEAPALFADSHALAAVTAERDRMAEALREIARTRVEPITSDDDASLSRWPALSARGANDIARAALKGTPDAGR